MPRLPVRTALVATVLWQACLGSLLVPQANEFPPLKDSRNRTLLLCLPLVDPTVPPDNLPQFSPKLNVPW